MSEDMDDMQSLKCREGDLAVIIFDERGCEDNVGRIVRVLGYPRTDKKLGICWLIEPEYDETWLVFSDGYIETDLRPFKKKIEHPDSWMIPLCSKRIERKSLLEVAA